MCKKINFNKLKTQLFKLKVVILDQLRLSIYDIALAGILASLGIVSATFIKINFGPMQAGIYIAFAIITALVCKPLIAYLVALVADNIQFILGGHVGSGLFALLPFIIVTVVLILKKILTIQKEKTWGICNFIFTMLTIIVILSVNLIQQDTILRDQGRKIDLSSALVQILIGMSLAILLLYFLVLNALYYKYKNSKIKKLINISLITTLTFIVASGIIGPIATIIGLNQIGGTRGNHLPGTSYYGKMYQPYLIIRIIKSVVSIPLHIVIVSSVGEVMFYLKMKRKNLG